MKKNFTMLFAGLIATSLYADGASGPAPAPQASAATVQSETTSTNRPPARRSGRSARRPAPELRTVPLVPGPAVVAVSPTSRVMVRGQGKLNSEIITRMTNGEPVVVIEEVQLQRSGPDEPSAWAKIVLPEKAHAWVHTSFIDPTNKTVIARNQLNLRGGPGENYSILGTLRPGETVKEIQTKDNWMEIEATPTAYAFMAAQYLKQMSPAEMTTAIPTEPVTPTTVSETPVVATTTTETIPETTAGTNDSTALMSQPQISLANPPVVEPPPPRIVQREGLVRGTISIQAPSAFELISPDNRRPINYLYTTSTNLDLARYKGLHIIVTGEEGLDERWKNTPVITIQEIRVIE